MENTLFKENVAMLLFGLELEDPESESSRLAFEKIFASFHFNPQVTTNLLFLRSSTEVFVGLSIRSEREELEERMRRYSEGMAYLLTYYFPNAPIRVASSDELLTIMDHLPSLTSIPKRLSEMGEVEENPNARIRAAFARVVDPHVLMEKVAEFYMRDCEQNPLSLENRLGIKSESRHGGKPKCDPRLFDLLQHSYLVYSFDIFGSDEALGQAAENENTLIVQREFLHEFLEYMGVPDHIEDSLRKAKSSAEILDTPSLVLMSPAQGANLLLRPIK